MSMAATSEEEKKRSEKLCAILVSVQQQAIQHLQLHMADATSYKEAREKVELREDNHVLGPASHLQRAGNNKDYMRQFPWRSTGLEKEKTKESPKERKTERQRSRVLWRLRQQRQGQAAERKGWKREGESECPMKTLRQVSDATSTVTQTVNDSASTAQASTCCEGS